MTITELEQMRARGEFHHATYRNIGTLWEGLWIYVRSENGFRGFTVAGSFPKDSPDLRAAETILSGSGISFGAYGQG